MKNNNNIQDPHIQQVNNRREEKGGGNGNPGCGKTPTEQTDGRGREKKTTEKRSQHLDLAEHASQCGDAECSRRKCRKMKGLLAHIRGKEDPADCKDCKVCPAITPLLTEHAKLCKVTTKI